MDDTIDRDLALDPNFGAQAWLDSLAQFSVNANLTIELGIVYGCLHVGYTNLVEERNARGVFVHHKLNEKESAEAGIFAIDTDRAFAAIRNYENQIPGLDSVVGPGGFFQSIRDMQGESKTVPAQRLWTNPETQKLMIDIYDGPDSLKTVNLGNRKLNFYELAPFAINTRNKMRYQPLIRKITLGEFYPPFPDRTPFDSANSLDPDRLDMMLFYMTKSIGEERRITFRQRIDGTNYYDKKNRGAVSAVMRNFVAYLNENLERDTVPWSWNPANGSADMRNPSINNDHADYDAPNMRDVAGKQTISEMPFRELPCGVGFNPKKINERPYYIPESIVEFMPSQMPGPWVAAAARKLVLASEKKLNIGDIEELFAEIDSFLSLLRDAEWSDAYLEGLENRNLPKILTQTGSWTLNPQVTDQRKLLKYPGANAINEFKTNADGGLDLPELGGAIIDNVPAGFANAVGILTLAREDKPGSLWKGIGERAKRVKAIFEELYTITGDRVGATKATDPAYSYPWSAHSGLATFMDAYIEPGAPLFMAIPSDGGSFNGKTVEQKKASKVVNDVNFDGFLNTVINDDLPIGNKERALASVNSRAGYLIAPILYGEPPMKYIDELCVILIEAGGYNLTTLPSEKRILNASAIAANISKEKPENVGAYINSLINASKKLLPDLIADAIKNNPAIMEDKDLLRMTRLRDYEKQSTIKGNVSDGPREKKDGDDEIARKKIAKEVFVGDYKNRPKQYLRTPLTDTPKLREYLRGKSFSYVLPGDRDYFFELPIEIGRLNGDDGRPIASDGDIMKKSKLRNLVSSRPLGATTSLNADNLMDLDKRKWYGKKKKKKTSNDDDDDDDSNIFSTLKSQAQSSSSSSFISNLLNDGASNLGRDFSKNNEFTRKGQEKSYYTESEQRAPEIMEGAYDYHREYMESEVPSKSVRFFYEMILDAPNTLEIHTKLATIGANIVEVMTVRPFIQAFMYAILLCKAGPSTWIYAYGHSSVQVTKELRGLFHNGGIIGICSNHTMLKTTANMK